MTSGNLAQVDVASLLAERSLPIDDVWTAAEGRLDGPIADGMNTAHEACDRWARDRSRLAMIVVHEDGTSERWTFADLSRASSRLARAYHSAGLRRGDRVAALVTRQIETFIAALAAWRAGLIYMPLFVGFGPDALAERLNAAAAAMVVVDHRSRQALDVTLSLLDGDPHILTVAGPQGRGLRKGDRSFWAEIDSHAADFGLLQTAAGDPATLMFTSGTTGPPKGCIEPHWLPLTIQPFLRHGYALAANDMLFATADPGWSYGLYTSGVGVMALGHPRVIYTGPFDPAAWLRVIENEQVTYPAGAPSAFRRLVYQARKGGGLPDSVRGASCAGEPLDATLTTAWDECGGGEIQDGYGLTEAAMLLGNLAFDERPTVPGSLSSVVPGFDVRLVDDHGDEADEQGIIAVHRPRYQASIGYWNSPEKWNGRWRGDWFLTGDIARRDEEGRWWFVGRADDVIVTSGYNVGPTEVENVVLEHPAIVEAAVVGSPDPDRGSVVRAVVVSDGSVPPEQVSREIQDSVRQRVGRHAYPRIVDFVSELPRTETGKLKRMALRSPAD